jgi:hypothetical protein
MAVIAVSSNATIKHGLLSSTAANRRGVQIRKKITPPIRNTTTRAQSSILSDVTQAPPDPILGVSVAFRECQNPNKLNLGVGAYRTEELKPYVLDVVKLAEKEMLAKGYDKEYLPMQGLAEFNTATAELLLGKDSEVIANKRIATVQSLSGTGSLRVGAAFIQKFLPPVRKFIYPVQLGATTRTSSQTRAWTGVSINTTTQRLLGWTWKACFLIFPRLQRAPS